jgi:hypothetical protein
MGVVVIHAVDGVPIDELLALPHNEIAVPLARGRRHGEARPIGGDIR